MKPDAGVEDWESLPITNPDAGASGSAGEDWEALPVQAPPKVEPSRSTLEPTSKQGAELRGFGQGASYGFADELGGAAAATAAKLSQLTDYLARTSPGRFVARKLTGLDGASDATIDAITKGASQDARQAVLGGDTPAEAFRGQREFLRADARTAEKTQPRAFYGGMVEGGIAGPKLPGMKRGNVLLRHLVNSAPTAALSSLGGSEAETLGGVAKDVGKGTAIGAPAGAVIGVGLEKGAPVVTNVLNRLWGDASLAAMGAFAGISDSLRKRGMKTAEQGREFGRNVFNEGVIPVSGAAESVREASEAAIPKRNAVVEDFLQRANDAEEANILAMATAAPNAKMKANVMERAPFNFTEMEIAGDRALRGVDPSTGMTKKFGLTTIAEDETTRAQKLIDQVGDEVRGRANRPPTPPRERTFMRANQAKRDAYGGINFVTDPDLKVEAERAVASGFRGNIEEQVGRALKDPSAGEALRLANRRTGTLIDAEAISAEAARRQLQAKQAGPLTLAATAMLGMQGHQNYGLPGLLVGALPVAAKNLAPYAGAPLAHGFNKAHGWAKWFEPYATRGAQGLGQSASTSASQAAQRPEPDDEDRNAFVKGNGG